VNQRFLVATAAVALFGAAAGWIIPKSAPAAGGPVEPITWWLCALLLGVLFTLFLLSHVFRVILRTLTVYLRLMNASQWEEHWKLYRAERRFTYTRGQTVLFLVLGVASAGLPLLLAEAYSLTLVWNTPARVVVAMLAFYTLAVVLMGFFDVFYSAKRIEYRWKKALDDRSAVMTSGADEGGSMAKGYWIARVDVADPEAYKAYVQANAEAFSKYGARFLVRAGRFENPEGSCRARNIVIEFPSYQAALDCWRSPEYQRAAGLRQPVSTVDLVVIDGYDGPQPS
jgi:uncharacterized protein (DUF1330 family)